MTERLQDYYDYVEARRHNLQGEQEQKRHNEEQERLTRESNAETVRSHQASEAIARDANAIQQQSNAWTYDVGSRNADSNAMNAASNSRQAGVAEGNLAVNRRNADTTYMKAFNDIITNNKNAATQSRKVMYDNLNAQERNRIDARVGRQNYEVALKNLKNANDRLALAWREYELNKTDKYWNNVLKSVSTFNSTADTWAGILGKKAPTTTIRVNRDETAKGKKWNGTVTLKDIAKIWKH